MSTTPKALELAAAPQPEVDGFKKKALAKKNRYCGADMCVESDKEHEPGCTRHLPQPEAQPTEAAQKGGV